MQNMSSSSVAEKKGLGKGGPKRYRKFLQYSIQGITKPAIVALCSKAGIGGISGTVYEQVRVILKSFLEVLVKRSVTLTDHNRRRTVSAEDVMQAYEFMSSTFGVPAIYRTHQEDQLKRCDVFSSSLAKAKAKAAEAKTKDKNSDVANEDDDVKMKKMKKKKRIIKRIMFYQKQSDCVIFPQLPFERLVREIAQDFKTDLLFSAKALGLIQIIAEEYLLVVLTNANIVAIQIGQRKTVMIQDLYAIMKIKGFDKIY